MIGQFGLTTLTILLGANVGWFVMALMAGKMRKSGALTYPAYIRRLFGAKAQAASSMISVVYLMGQIAGQFVACGTMAHLLGLCSFQTGIVAGMTWTTRACLSCGRPDWTRPNCQIGRAHV